MSGSGGVAGKSLAEARRVLAELATAANSDTIERWAELLHGVIEAGGKIMICGNGGSSCDAAHFAEELTGRFRADRRPLPAIACTDVGHITCTANDYGFDHVFSRWVAALGRPGDALILLSTSGNSNNIAEAARAGREQRMTTLALLGKNGGALRGRCEYELIVPGATSDRIQELHMLVLHILVEGIEARLAPGAG
jgi:D-sedoheptulose 7-phosphate isomerase